MGIIFCLFVLVGWASNNYETGLFSWAGCWYGWQEGDRHGLCGRLPSVWSRYLAAWESTWFPGRTEQHADYLVITSLHFFCLYRSCWTLKAGNAHGGTSAAGSSLFRSVPRCSSTQCLKCLLRGLTVSTRRLACKCKKTCSRHRISSSLAWSTDICDISKYESKR